MRSILLLFSIVSSLIVQAQYVILNISQKNNAPNEVSVAVDQNNLAHIVAASNLINVYCSADSGKTWHEFKQKTDLGPYGDPVILCDDSGIFYHAHLSKTPGKERPDYMDRMIVQRSTDGGKTWNNGVGVGYNKGKMQDKEWLSVNTKKGNQYYGNVYMSWTEFDVYGSKDPENRSRIRFARSIDRGLSFEEPVIVSDNTGDCQDGDSTLEGATSVSTSNGDVIVVWAGLNKIYLDRSTDGGQSFGKDRVIAEQNEGWTHDIPNIFRTNGMPFIATDPSTDKLYISYSDRHEGDSFYRPYLLCNAGIDGRNKRIEIPADDGPFNGHCFFPNLAWNDQSKTLGLIYYQMDPQSAAIQTKLALIRDDKVQEIIALGNPFPAPGKELFFGDYIDLDAFGDGFFCTWTAYENNQLIIKGARPADSHR